MIKYAEFKQYAGMNIDVIGNTVRISAVSRSEKTNDKLAKIFSGWAKWPGYVSRQFENHASAFGAAYNLAGENEPVIRF